MDALKGKKLLILGSSIVNCKFVEAAKELGIYTIVTDINPKGPAKLIADEALNISVFDVEALTEFCRKNNVSGVGNFTNTYSQLTQQAICEKLGLPSYGTRFQYEVFTDKTLYKKVCVENGVDIIPEYDPEDPDSIEYPVIVKPADSSGSRGITVCYNREQFDAAVALAKKETINGKLLVERYMGGKQDFSVTYVISDGKANLIRTGDRYLGRKEDGLERQCICAISPSRHSRMYMEKVNANVIRMFNSLGMKNCPVFFQGFVDGDTVRFYDPGIRFPGTDYELLFLKVTGMNPMKSVDEYLVTGNKINDYDGALDEGYKLNGKCAIQLYFDSRAGKIAKYEGMDKIEKLPYVVAFAQKASVGDVIPASGDVKQRVAEAVMLVDDTPDNIRNAIKEVQSLFTVEDENGQNMLVSRIDADSLKL